MGNGALLTQTELPGAAFKVKTGLIIISNLFGSQFLIFVMFYTIIKSIWIGFTTLGLLRLSFFQVAVSFVSIFSRVVVFVAMQSHHPLKEMHV